MELTEEQIKAARKEFASSGWQAVQSKYTPEEIAKWRAKGGKKGKGIKKPRKNKPEVPNE